MSVSGRNLAALCLLALSVAVALVLLIRPGLEISERWHRTASSGQPEQRSESGTGGDVPERDVRRSVSLEGSHEASADSVTKPTTFTASIQVSVVDLHGQPEPGVGIVLSDGDLSILTGEVKSLGRSGPDGSATLQIDRNGVLVAVDLTHATVRGCSIDVSEGVYQEAMIIVAPRLEIAGVVVDELEHAVPDAELSIIEPADLLAHLESRTDRFFVPEWKARTDPTGSFRFDVLPKMAGAKLSTRHIGHANDQRSVPQSSATDLRIVLAGELWAGSSLLGLVRAGAAPVADAEVLLGSSRTKSGSDGRFELKVSSPLPRTAILVAHKQGFAPATRRDYGQVVWETSGSPPFVELDLGPETLSISGHVIGRDGSPCHRWRVSLVDGTSLAPERLPPTFVEELDAEVSGGALTNDNGAFRLSGLCQRDYVLRAWDPASLVNIQSAPVAAGTQDCILTAPSDSVRAIEGIVVSHRGKVLMDVEVVTVLVTAGDPHTVIGSIWESGGRTRTDVHGAFRLDRFPRTGAHLNLYGEAILPDRCFVEPNTMDRPLRVSVAERWRFRIESSGEELQGLTLQVRDSEGLTLPIYVLQQNVWEISTAYLLEGSRSPVLSVSEDVSELVLLNGTKPVRSVTVTPTLGEIFILHL